MKRNPTDAEKYAYLAGIIDGEGSIMILEDKRNPDKTIYRVRITVCNTNLDIIDWLTSNFSGYVVSSQGQANWKKANTWICEKQDLLEPLVVGIFPYSIIKKKQLCVVLNFIYKDVLDNGRKMFEEMKELNKKGNPNGPSKDVRAATLGT